MKAIPRILALWAVLIAAAWLMMLPGRRLEEGVMWMVVLPLPALGVWLTGRVVSVLPSGRAGMVGRWLFWMGTVSGWLAVILIGWGRFEHATHGDARQMLWVTLACAVAIPAWAAVKARTFPTWRAAGDASIGAVLVVGLCGMAVWRYEARTAALTAEAEARWAEIGMPLTESGNAVLAQAENGGAGVLRGVLAELLGTGIYREGSKAAEAESIPGRPESGGLVKVACEVISHPLSPRDEVALENVGVTELEARAAELEAAYAKVLASEAPRWKFDPATADQDMPNFLALRKFGQIASADAIRRFSLGDVAGARRAIEAGLRTSEKLAERLRTGPILFRVAMEGLFAKAEVRLDFEADEWGRLAVDAETLRKSLISAMRAETWYCLNYWRLVDEVPEGVFDRTTARLPNWLRAQVDRRLAKRDGAVGARQMAEHVAVQQSRETMMLPDLGAARHEALDMQYPSRLAVNVNRSTARLNAMLLLREQVALIRDARARLSAGRALESRDSVVMPGQRWEVSGDAVNRTASIRLAKPPEWLEKSGVVGSDFWLLPLDGSKAWQFRAAAGAAAVR